MSLKPPVPDVPADPKSKIRMHKQLAMKGKGTPTIPQVNKK